MNNKPVVFFDSGIGGMPYLSLARNKLPHEQFIYVADSKYFPYGTKPHPEIKCAVLEAMGKIMKAFTPKAVVIACNTASVVALADLRVAYALPIIGVVPAVKPAAEQSLSKQIAVIATSETIKNGYLKDLIQKFAQDCTVLTISADPIVEFVEKRLVHSSRTERLRIIEDFMVDIKENNVDMLVLACTHFLHLSQDFSQILGQSVRVVDSREGVIKQLARVLKEKKLSALAGNPDQANFLYTTGAVSERNLYPVFARKFDLTYKGSL